MGVGIQFADQSVSIVFGGCSQVRNKGLHRFTAGFSQYVSAAEIRGITLHKICIQIELSDQKAELVAESGPAMA
jgi:hypothetical protein